MLRLVLVVCVTGLTVLRYLLGTVTSEAEKVVGVNVQCLG